MLFATALFAWGSFVRKQPEPGETHLPPWRRGVAQFFIAIYGGYFGGGIGFLMMAALTMAGARGAHRGRDQERARRRDERLGGGDLRLLARRALAAGRVHRRPARRSAAGSAR